MPSAPYNLPVPSQREGSTRMTRKDPSPVDLENAETATGRMSRRSLVARAGLAGLTAALVIDRGALASAAAPVDRTNVPTDADTATLALVIGLELAASELYRAKLASGTGSAELATAVGVMAENHQAYAQAIAGATGLSAGAANETIVADRMSGFTGSDDDFFTAAHQLEQEAVATHTAAIPTYGSDDAISLTASILIMEARQATVLADLLGVTDLDVLFGNDATALDLAGDA